MWAVDLAPRHKLGLPLPTRVILAAGISRLGIRQQVICDLAGVGAIVTGPWTWEPHWDVYPALVARPGGVLWRPERPRTSLSRALEEAAATWEHLPVPVLAAMAAVDVAHVQRVSRRLADVPTVAGIWLESHPEEEIGAVLARIDVVRRTTALPVLVALPLTRATAWARPCVHAGADALVIGMPLEGEIPLGDRWIRGRLYGPLLLPLTLAALRATAPQLDGTVPLIAQGGIHAPQDAVLCRAVGADAVALDAAVWVEPALPQQVWDALQHWETTQQEEPSHESGHSTGQ